MSPMKKILVVDDDNASIDTLVDYLIDHKFEVDWALTPKDAINHLHQKKYHLIILDIMMNNDVESFEGVLGINTGISLYTYIRKQDPEIPILVYTARGDLFDYFHSEPNVILKRKPLEFQDLKKIIDNQLDK